MRRDTHANKLVVISKHQTYKRNGKKKKEKIYSSEVLNPVPFDCEAKVIPLSYSLLRKYYLKSVYKPIIETLIKKKENAPFIE